VVQLPPLVIEYDTKDRKDIASRSLKILTNGYRLARIDEDSAKDLKNVKEFIEKLPESNDRECYMNKKLYERNTLNDNLPTGPNGNIRGYIRVSTNEQSLTGFSLDVQRTRIIDYAIKRQMSVVKMYSDPGISGSVLERPELMKLFGDIQPREYLVVVNLDRLSRKQLNTNEYLKKLSDARADLIVIEPEMNTSTAIGRLLFGIINSIAEHERDLIRSRISGTMRNMKNLKPKAPFGWRSGGKGEPLKKDDEEQRAIQFIRNAVAENPKITRAELRDKLNAAHLKCRKSNNWYDERIKRICEQNDIVMLRYSTHHPGENFNTNEKKDQKQDDED
jgi:DNA invertase Pin-like site-specific DNA recombinase